MRIALAAFALLIEVAPTFAQTLQAPSEWKNQRGSELRIESVDGSGAFKGHYVNNAAGFGCQGVPYDVTGKVDGQSIQFVVLWVNATERCNSLTSWRGIVSGRTISTNWQLATVDKATGEVKLIAGESVFERTK
jgi:Avidin family